MNKKFLNTSTAEQIDVTIRPAERILSFINEITIQGSDGNEVRLPSIRDISRQLHVSVPTVQSVFRKLTIEGKIRTRIGDGTFLVSGQVLKGKGIRIALNFSMHQDPQMEDWMMCISMGLLRAASSSKENVSFAPIQEDDINDERAIERIIARRKDVDGLLLFPCKHMERIRKIYEDDCKPVVTITQPAANSTSNFVSPDYYSTSFILGQSLRKVGRRHALLILAQTIDESLPMRNLHAGFVNGFGVGCSDDLSFEVVEGVGHCEQIGRKVILDRLNRGGKIPDIVYSSNDYLALGVAEAFKEAGFKIPSDVSVIGGTGLGLSNTNMQGLTRVAQPMEGMGMDLLSMICRRIRNNGESLPGIFIPAGFTGTATARRQELVELGCAPNPL